MPTTTHPIPATTLKTGTSEVRLATGRLNLIALVGTLLIFILGSLLYNYIWEGFSAYSSGYLLGSILYQYFWETLLCAFLANLLLNYLLFYLLNGRKAKDIGFIANWAGVAFYTKRPLPLKFFRLVLLLPAILLGVLPAVHGFCTGQPVVYFFGLMSLAAAIGDLMLWYKVRPFDDDDLAQGGKGPFAVTITRRNYHRYND